MIKYIDAEKLTKDFERLCDIVCRYSKKQRDVMCGSCPLGDAFEMLDNQPAADVVEVKHGRWEDPEDLTCYKCSVCGEYATQEYGLTEPIFWHYCPNCGSRMDLGGDEEWT